MDEDADPRAHLAALGLGALADLRKVLEGFDCLSARPTRGVPSRPGYEDLATMIAMVDTDEVVRLRPDGR